MGFWIFLGVFGVFLTIGAVFAWKEEQKGATVSFSYMALVIFWLVSKKLFSGDV